jgi:colanic acid biosynthesis protein WcaH
MLSREQFASVLDNAPLVSIDLVIENGRGEFLVGRRNNEPAKGFYFVPGGRIRKNETIADAFERISKNELNELLRFTDAVLHGAYEHFYEKNSLGIEGISTHYVVIAYRAGSTSEEIRPNDSQHAELVWMTPAELLGNEDVHPNTKRYFQ